MSGHEHLGPLLASHDKKVAELTAEIDRLRAAAPAERVVLDPPVLWTDFVKQELPRVGMLVWFRSRREPRLIGHMNCNGGGFEYGDEIACDCFDPGFYEKVWAYQIVWTPAEG